MRRIGSTLALVLLASATAFAEVEFTMQADRQKVGTEDTFRLEIVIANAPEGAVLQLPAPQDFEVLGRSESTQMSYSMGPGGAGVIKQVRKHTLTMRANRPGTLTIPPAGLQTATRQYKTQPVTMEVVRGRLAPDRPRTRTPPNPFGLPPGFPGLPGFDDDDDPFATAPAPDLFDEPSIPRGDSDLFLRMSVDKSEVYVGEQVMLTIHIYSRVDLASVDGVTMPKLEGFLSQDFKSPTQLMPEQRTIGGVPYREYLLRQKALFPMKPGEQVIDAPEADITTGIFFAGRRVHRKGNEVKLKVRPLPPGGQTNLVGRWRLSRQVSQTEVALGEPVQVKLVVEGRGNLQSVQLPPLGAPPSFKTFDPETTDKPSNSKSHVGGARTVEYTLVPQQTGAFTLPAMSLQYFDPEQRRYDETRVDEVTITVRAGAGGASVVTVPGVPTGLEGPKNQLVAGGLKSLRHTARFAAPAKATWAQPWFLPLAAAPFALTLLGFGVAFVRGALGQESPEARKKQQAKAARKRLSAAEKLLKQGSTADFYAEVARALTSFLEAKLDAPLAGLTRAELATRLEAAGVEAAERARIAAVLETCDMGRYAPGMGDAAARRRALEDAAAAMEGWS
jgi:hypothetical protein